MKQKVIGPRGGVSIEDVSCYTCLCWPGCTLVNTTKEFGCGDWVNEAGQRLDFDEAEDVPDGTSGLKDCVGCGKCEDVLEPPPQPLKEENTHE
jgi:hypothetical protein